MMKPAPPRKQVNRSATPGICRIDQPHKHNHGWFVRIQRRGKIYPVFFSDKKHGGRRKALAAAQAHQRRMADDLGAPLQISRREWAEIRRRRGRSGIYGVQRVVDRRTKPWQKYWRATWSPEPGKVRKRQFSIRKYGDEAAKLLAIHARQEGLRQMK